MKGGVKALAEQRVLQTAQAVVRRYQELDAKVDRAEGDGLAARWAFGREMMKEAEAHDGRMPHGRLEELAEATGKSITELKYRRQFAEEHPKLANALACFHSWHDFVNPAPSGSDGMGVHYSSESPEWETPQDLFDALNAEFHFTLDVCATPENAKCNRFFGEPDDGLAQEWSGVCWMNPPYGSAIEAWIRKASEVAQGGTTVVCLVPARVDTAWWWDYCRQGEVRFLRGRLKFGGGETGAPFPSAVVVLPRTPTVVWWEWQAA